MTDDKFWSSVEELDMYENLKSKRQEVLSVAMMKKGEPWCVEFKFKFIDLRSNLIMSLNNTFADQGISNIEYWDTAAKVIFLGKKIYYEVMHNSNAVFEYVENITTDNTWDLYKFPDAKDFKRLSPVKLAKHKKYIIRMIRQSINKIPMVNPQLEKIIEMLSRKNWLVYADDIVASLFLIDTLFQVIHKDKRHIEIWHFHPGQVIDLIMNSQKSYRIYGSN